MKNPFFILFSFLCSLSALKGQTISEKKASLVTVESGIDPLMSEDLNQVNMALEEKHSELKMLYEVGYDYYSKGVSNEEYTLLIEKIKGVKKEIREIGQMWRKEMATSEGYALWHQPEASLVQLMMDYGAGEYVYVIPPEIGSIPISINSNLPIPREAWEECL